MDFQCSLCRYALKSTIIKEIARLVVKQDMFESFKELSQMLALNKDRKNKLIVSLLIKHQFNICLVENDLFEMIGLYVSPILEKNKNEEENVQDIEAENRQDLSHEEKQVYFDLARAPVLKLQKELRSVYKKLEEFSGKISI